jgi:tetratricopeptide (TPR) repeat protein
MRTQIGVLFIVGLIGWFHARPAMGAENEGQDDLDKAIETKIAAESLTEWSTVIDLCQSALDKGLDEGNEEFCKQLLSSTLLQRAEAFAERIFDDSRDLGPQAAAFYRQALKDVDRSIEIDPKQAIAQLLLGKLQSVRGGDLKKARQALNEAIRLAASDDATKAEALRWRAGTSDKLDDRLNDLSEAIKLAPNDAKPLRERGAAYLAAEQAAEALADFDAALKLDAEHADTYEARGMALGLLRRYDEARESFGRAGELAPESAVPWLQRARISALAGDFDQAVADANHALEIKPDEINGLVLKAQSLALSGKAEEAIPDANRALQLNPESDDVVRVWTMVIEKAGQTKTAIKELRQQVEANPDDAVAWLQLGLLYAAGHESLQAIDAFSAALKLDPRRDFVYQVRADTYLGRGMQKEAIADYRAALKLDATNSGVLNNLAWVLATSPDESLRDGERAIVLATKACELTGHRQAHILSTLAAAFAETGDFKSARKWSKQSIEIADDSLKDQLGKELASYEKDEPWREKQSGAENDARP